MTRVFISYNHHQGPWVWKRLVPCLRAGGTEVLVDRERFKLGKAVVGQMDALQDQANKHLLVLSAEYLQSDYCRHEMKRAIALDPDFKQGLVVPVLRGACKLPRTMTRPNPLYADLQDERQSDSWTMVLQQCDATQLGVSALDWLAARDDIVQFLEQGQSVNLLVKGRVAWLPLLEHIQRDYIKDLMTVDLQPGGTAPRHGLLATILHVLGVPGQLPAEPDDLAEFERILLARKVSRVALTHFDMAKHRHDYYGIDLFASLRYLIMDARKLVLLVQSRTPFDTLLPRDYPLSSSPIDIKTVDLQAKL